MNIRIIGSVDFASQHMKRNWVIYSALLAIFMLGILIGTFYYKNVDSNEEIFDYMEELFLKLNEKEKINNYEILKESIAKNIITACSFLILGASVVGIPLLLVYVIYKGFTLGFAISALISMFGFLKGNVLSFVMLFLKNYVVFFMMIVAITSAVKLAANLLKNKKDIRMELLRHAIVCMCSAVGLIAGSITEYFVVSRLVEIVVNKI